MIRSFACRDTERLFNDEPVRRFVNIIGPARRKLQYLHAAGALEDLRVPPGNRLEALKGDRKANTAFASIANGAFVFAGLMALPRMLRSLTIIRALEDEGENG